MRLCRDVNPRRKNAFPISDEPIEATFDSDADENLISRDVVERVSGRDVSFGKGSCVVVLIEFNILGQKQRFETSHRIVDINITEGILFNKCRPKKDTSDPSSLELHILMRGALSDGCTCCAESVCRLNDRARFQHTTEEIDGCPTTFAGGQPIQPSSSSMPRAMHKGFGKGVALEPDSSLMHGGETLSTSNDKARQLGGHRMSPAARETMRMRNKPRIRPAWKVLAGRNEYASSQVPLEDSDEGDSDSSSSPAVSMRSTRSNSPDVLAQTGSQQQPRSPRLRSKALVGQQHVTHGQRCSQEVATYAQGQNSDPPSECSTSPTESWHHRQGKGNPATDSGGESSAAAALRNIFKDGENGSNEIDYANENMYPILPFPDDYWIYDFEAKNYYHVDLEDDGKEIKIWYPEEFLESNQHE
ncbi:hypothetical protein PG984_010440 [Apiospora sp. TS-2023a]